MDPISNKAAEGATGPKAQGVDPREQTERKSFQEAMDQARGGGDLQVSRAEAHKVGGQLDEALDGVGSLREEHHRIESQIASMKRLAKQEGSELSVQLLELQMLVQQFGMKLEMASKVMESGAQNFKQLLQQNV